MAERIPNPDTHPGPAGCALTLNPWAQTANEAATVAGPAPFSVSCSCLRRVQARGRGPRGSSGRPTGVASDDTRHQSPQQHTGVHRVGVCAPDTVLGLVRLAWRDATPRPPVRGGLSLELNQVQSTTREAGFYGSPDPRPENPDPRHQKACKVIV